MVHIQWSPFAVLTLAAILLPTPGKCENKFSPPYEAQDSFAIEGLDANLLIPFLLGDPQDPPQTPGTPSQVVLDIDALLAKLKLCKFKVTVSEPKELIITGGPGLTGKASIEVEVTGFNPSVEGDYSISTNPETGEVTLSVTNAGPTNDSLSASFSSNGSFTFSGTENHFSGDPTTYSGSGTVSGGVGTAADPITGDYDVSSKEGSGRPKKEKGSLTFSLICPE